MVPVGQLLNSSWPHLGAHDPLTHSSLLVHAVCGRQMVQPVGAFSHFSGAPLVHRAAPSVQTSLHMGTHTPVLQVSPAWH